MKLRKGSCPQRVIRVLRVEGLEQASAFSGFLAASLATADWQRLYQIIC